MTRIVLGIVLPAFLLSTGGCMIAAVGAGAAGTVAYFKGDLESVEAASLEQLYAATEKAVEEMELFVISKKKDALGGAFTLRDTADKKIMINLTAVTPETTKLTIRVGVFGDETKSQRMYETIKKYLEN